MSEAITVKSILEMVDLSNVASVFESQARIAARAAIESSVWDADEIEADEVSEAVAKATEAVAYYVEMSEGETVALPKMTTIEEVVANLRQTKDQRSKYDRPRYEMTAVGNEICTIAGTKKASLAKCGDWLSDADRAEIAAAYLANA